VSNALTFFILAGVQTPRGYQKNPFFRSPWYRTLWLHQVLKVTLSYAQHKPNFAWWHSFFATFSTIFRTGRSLLCQGFRWYTVFRYNSPSARLILTTFKSLSLWLW
jgi:hypothetical protein